MSKFINLLRYGAIFPFVIGLIAILNISQIGGEENILEREGRRKTPWPQWNRKSLLQGTFTRQLEEAFGDHFLFREQALKASDLLEALKGLPGTDAKIVAGKADLLTAQVAPGTELAELPASQTQKPVAQWVNNLLVYGDRVYMLTGYLEENANYYAWVLNALATKLPASTKIYCLLVPTAIEFLDAEEYRKLSYPQNKGISNIYAKLSPGIKRIDAIPEMGAHRTEYLYFRTDHHWTALGAYYAYRASGPVMDFKPVEYKEYQKETLTGFVGSLYNATRAPSLLANPDSVEILYPTVEHDYTRYYASGVKNGKAVDKAYAIGFNSYLAYLAGDVPQADIKTKIMNGRKILILKDSYGNAFIPYLIPHFQEIHIIDPRYWSGSILDYVKTHGITEVLFFNNYVITLTGFPGTIARVSGL